MNIVDTTSDRTNTPNARGFSLVEMMIVACVFGILSTLVIAGLERNQTFASTEMSRAAVEGRFQEAVDRLRRELAVARVDVPIDSGTRVRYMLPVDHDGDGLVYDAAGAITWGYSTGGAPVAGAAAWFAFVADQVVTEAALDFDVNRDGDELDSYQLGHVEQQLPDGAIRRLTGSTVLQKAGNPGGDVDEDGKLDPLFEVYEAGRSRVARLRFFGLYRLADGGFARFDYDSTIRLQNDAP